MSRTRVGYTGGTLKNPTYHNLGNHTETLQLDFDPSKISYEQLLDIFWASHHPAARPHSRQYMAAVFYHNEEQKKLAEKTLDKIALTSLNPVHTVIAPVGEFYLAEDYHQKYRLRRVPALVAEYQAIYPNLEDFVHSTATARVNGYVGGEGRREQLAREIDRLGLSEQSRALLGDIVAYHGR